WRLLAALGEFQRRRPAGYISCATSLLRQAPRQSEVCEKAALAEPRDGRHAVLTQRQHHHGVGADDRCVEIWKIAAECGLAVGASRHEPEVRAATVTALASDESRNRLAALVLVGLRRHRQPGVIREQRDQSWCITLLHGGDEAADEFALTYRARQRDKLAITDREPRVERRAGALQRTLDRRLARLEHLGDFGRPQAQPLA